MKPVNFFLLLFLTNANVQGQDNPPNFVRGLITEDYSAQPDLTPFNSLGSEQSYPNIYSLKKHCPPVQNQQQLSSCTAWATAYAAYSISRAASENITDIQEIRKIALSALFLYNNIKATNCRSGERDFCGGCGSGYETAFEFMKSYGNVRHIDYDGPDNNVCAKYLSSSGKEQASQNRIKAWSKLFFDYNLTGEGNKVNKIIEQIYNNNPVLISMVTEYPEANDIFSRYVNRTTGIWTPPSSARGIVGLGNHAMVIVGYNNEDGYFDVMNSWGTTGFGADGFFKLRFKDLEKYVYYAGIIFPDHRKDDKLTLSCEINKIELRSDGIPYSSGKLPVRLNKNKYFIDYPISINDRFQVLIDNLKQGNYIYVLSADINGKFSLHYPFNGTDRPIIPSNKSYLILPGGTKVLKITKKEDNLILLTSKHPITDIVSRIFACNEISGTNNIEQTFLQVFDDILIESAKINTSPEKIQLSATTGSRKAVYCIVNFKLKEL